MPMAYTPMSAQQPSEVLRAFIAETFFSEQVAPTVALLCHESVPCTGEIFSVGAGRTGRVSFVVSPGYQTDHPTPESIRDHFDDVMSAEGQVIAASATNDTVLFPADFAAMAARAKASGGG